MFRSATYRILMAAVLITVVRPSAAAEIPAAIVWKTDLTEAYDLAKSTQKPMVVYIYSEDQDGLAPYCLALEKGTLSSREVNFLSNSAVFVRVNSGIDDSKGNVKKLIAELNVTRVPFVGVLECRTDALLDWGQIIGDISTNDFAIAMREYLIRAAISIGASQRPLINEEEIVQRFAKCQDEFTSLRDKFVAANETYLSHQTRLLERGEFNADEFVTASRTLSEIQMQMQRCFFEFTTIPSDDVRDYGRILMSTNFLLYSEVQFLEEDLVGLTANGRLTGPFTVIMAQTKVRELNAKLDRENVRINESLTKAKENFQRRFDGFVSN